MDNVKHRVLLCSPQVDFLQKYKADLDRDFEIQVASTEEIALFLVKDWKAHIAIVDGDKFGNLTTQLRQSLSYSQLGIVVVAQADGIFKEEYAFRTGADHFIGNLQGYKQLVWRVVSLLRKVQGVQLPGSSQHPSARAEDKTPSSITFKNIKIFPHDYIIKCNGRVIKVTPIQFKLLVAFITRSDQLLTREWIKENIWESAEISPRSIDAQISKLKKVLPEIGKNIINIYGQGYILTPENKHAA